MKTKDKPEIKQALEDAEREAGETLRVNMYQYYLLQALVFAICEVADGINQIVADLPSHDK